MSDITYPISINDLNYESGRHPAINIKCWASVVDTIFIEGLTRNGYFIFPVTTTSNYTLVTKIFNIDDYPIFLRVITNTATTRRGQIFVAVYILHGQDTVTCAGSGYISKMNALAWPWGTYESSVGGRGMLNSVTGTNPAANVEISETVPANARWHLKSIRFTLVTDANAANRRVHVQITDGTFVLMDFPAGLVQTASTTVNYNCAEAETTSAALIASEAYINLPTDLFLFQGWKILTVTDNKQVGDNYGAAQMCVEEWIEE